MIQELHGLSDCLQNQQYDRSQSSSFFDEVSNMGIGFSEFRRKRSRLLPSPRYNDDDDDEDEEEEEEDEDDQLDSGEFSSSEDQQPSNHHLTTVDEQMKIDHVKEGLKANRQAKNISGSRSGGLPVRKRRRASRSGGPRINKGLRHYSIKVCEKLSQMGTTTYNEIANALVRDFLIETKFPVEAGDEKNIRRRIYDALNVLCAMEIIYKDKKKIRWKGLEHTSGVNSDHLQTAKKQKRERIQKKKDTLSDMTLQFIALQNLIERNGNDVRLLSKKMSSANGTNAELTDGESKAHRRSNEKLHIPFIVVNSKPDAELECEMSNDLDEVCFDYNSTFQIHDDNHILRQLGLASADSKPLHDLIPLELRQLLADTKLGRALKSQDAAYNRQVEQKLQQRVHPPPPPPPHLNQSTQQQQQQQQQQQHLAFSAGQTLSTSNLPTSVPAAANCMSMNVNVNVNMGVPSPAGRGGESGNVGGSGPQMVSTQPSSTPQQHSRKQSPKQPLSSTTMSSGNMSMSRPNRQINQQFLTPSDQKLFTEYQPNSSSSSSSTPALQKMVNVSNVGFPTPSSLQSPQTQPPTPQANGYNANSVYPNTAEKRTPTPAGRVGASNMLFKQEFPLPMNFQSHLQSPMTPGALKYQIQGTSAINSTMSMMTLPLSMSTEAQATTSSSSFNGNANGNSQPFQQPLLTQSSSPSTGGNLNGIPTLSQSQMALNLFPLPPPPSSTNTSPTQPSNSNTPPPLGALSFPNSALHSSASGQSQQALSTTPQQQQQQASSMSALPMMIPAVMR